MFNARPAPAQLEIPFRLNLSLSKLHVMLTNSVSGQGQLTNGSFYRLTFWTWIRLTVLSFLLKRATWPLGDFAICWCKCNSSGPFCTYCGMYNALNQMKHYPVDRGPFKRFRLFLTFTEQFRWMNVRSIWTALRLCGNHCKKVKACRMEVKSSLYCSTSIQLFLCSQEVGSCRNRLDTSSSFWSTFAQHMLSSR